MTERSRPSWRSFLGATVHLSLPSRPNFMKITRFALSAATASVPSSRPHCVPWTQEAPDVATVGSPELHRALIWRPGSDWSVIGTDSL